METIADNPTREANTISDNGHRKPAFNPNKVAYALEKLGLGYFGPMIRLLARDEPTKQLRILALNTFLPVLAFALFVAGWHWCSTIVKSGSVKIPSPAETWYAWQGTLPPFPLSLTVSEADLKGDKAFMKELPYPDPKSIVGFAMAESAARQTFEAQRSERVAKFMARAEAAEAAGKAEQAEKFRANAAEFASKSHQGNRTFYDQISISLVTISIGFVCAALLAIPLGILCGVSPLFNTAINPLVQLFKPVSPLAWFPIVFVFTTWGIDKPDSDSIWQRALFTSAGVVTLCSLWPTLINTAVGVSSVDKDHLNVAKVLKLDWWDRLTKIILPASLPMIFTGLRLSVGVGWMVLVAADMMAQNQGLGKFVWDMYQNGDTMSTAQIIVAVFVIGGIGFLLDRVMLVLQRLVTFEANPGH